MAKTVKAAPREDLYVERSYVTDDPNAVVGVNGLMYVMPRGNALEVPSFVAAEFRRSRRAAQRLEKTVDALLCKEV